MTLGEESLNLLKALSESFGPSGFERETTAIVKREAQCYADEIGFDKLGSVIARSGGTLIHPSYCLLDTLTKLGSL